MQGACFPPPKPPRPSHPSGLGGKDWDGPQDWDIPPVATPALPQPSRWVGGCSSGLGHGSSAACSFQCSDRVRGCWGTAGQQGGCLPTWTFSPFCPPSWSGRVGGHLPGPFWHLPVEDAAGLARASLPAGASVCSEIALPLQSRGRARSPLLAWGRRRGLAVPGPPQKLRLSPAVQPSIPFLLAAGRGDPLYGAPGDEGKAVALAGLTQGHGGPGHSPVGPPRYRQLHLSFQLITRTWTRRVSRAAPLGGCQHRRGRLVPRG